MAKTKRKRRAAWPPQDRQLSHSRIAVPLWYDTHAVRSVHAANLGDLTSAVPTGARAEIALSEGSGQVHVYVSSDVGGADFNFDVDGDPAAIRSIGEVLVAAAIKAERVKLFAEARANQAKRGAK